MIEVITPGNRHFYGPVIESMFRMRYRALAEYCGGRIPDLTGERDCDPYDTKDTSISSIARLKPGASSPARLNPTTKSHSRHRYF